MKNDQLKPCPCNLCGSTKVKIFPETRTICCANEGCPNSKGYTTFEEWNRRPAPATATATSKVVRFDCHGHNAPAYGCDQPGDQSGDYILVVEAERLERDNAALRQKVEELEAERDLARNLASEVHSRMTVAEAEVKRLGNLVETVKGWCKKPYNVRRDAMARWLREVKQQGKE